MTYKPLPDYLTIQPSKINGLGLFTLVDIDKGVNLGMSHIIDSPTLDTIRTPLGGFINHSDDPNSYIATNKGDRILHTIKPVKAGEEITVYYRFKGYDGIIGDDTEVEIEH